MAWEWYRFPDIAALATKPPETTAFMERRKAELRAEGKDDTLRREWVPYARISPNLRRAVLVAEDNEFYDHEGVDVQAMREAFERNWKRGRITHGGSTITQQLAKNLYLSPSRNPMRKLREYLIARSLEENLTKKRILEIYLNSVEFGERVYGAEAAARFYFKKSAASLTPSQAALLAGCLPNPRVMNPASPNKRLRARQKMILSRMRRWGAVFEKEVLTQKKPAAAPAVPEETTTTETAAGTDSSTAIDTASDEPVEETTTADETTTDTTATETSGTSTLPATTTTGDPVPDPGPSTT